MEPGKGGERVTLKMIAEKAGTSIGTVDRALSNRGGISEKTKARVMEVARDMGYRTNLFASALSRKRVLRLGLVYPVHPRGFYRFIDQGVDKAAGELESYGVQVEKLQYAMQDPAEQSDLLRRADLTRFDGLAINAAGASALEPLQELARRGVPLITFNTDAVDLPRLFFVGNNSHQSGRMGAELLFRLMGGRGFATVLGNFSQATPFSERFGGFCEVLRADYPSIQLYPCLDCLSRPELATKYLRDLLARVPELGGVFCTGYSSTVGALEALRAANRKDIVLIGYDVGEETAAALREGWCDALLYQDPYQQGYQAPRLLARHLLEGWLPPQPKLHIETRIILKSNLEAYCDDAPRWDMSL